MFEDVCAVSEDRTANGRVHHRLLVAGGRPRAYTRSVDAAGVTHAKHADAYRVLPVPDGFAVAGQDVYGATAKSIVVADGHGPNGADMALRAVAMATAVDDYALGCVTNPRRVEADVREIVKAYLMDAPDTRSGATYVQMLFHQWRHKRWVITVNVGDSEALLVDSASVLQCSMAHNWDAHDVYQRYRTTCTGRPQPVCYNRWNAGKYAMTGPGGSHTPIMLYDAHGQPRWDNAEFVANKLARRGRPFGTQSIRMPTYAYENWGSCVCVNNKALGQLVACYGDQRERQKTGTSYDMIHVYIHELASHEDVIAIVQSDGVSNAKTLQDCGRQASWPAASYMRAIPEPKDDMSVVISRWSPKTTTPCPMPSNVAGISDIVRQRSARPPSHGRDRR